MLGKTCTLRVWLEMNRLGKLIAGGLVTISLGMGCSDSSKSSSSAYTSTGGASTGVTQPTSSSAVASKSDPVRVTVPGVTKIPADKLAIGDYMPPLDDDRIGIAKPQGWRALPRNSAYLTRFYQSNPNRLPRIEITVEVRTYGDLETVMSENIEQFAKLVAADLGDLELVENVVPLQIGDTACARYVGRVELILAAEKKISAERQRLLVLQDGRLYTIDLLVLPNTLRRSRDAAYAVCASLRFGKGSALPTTGKLLPE